MRENVFFAKLPPEYFYFLKPANLPYETETD